jgi:hypothetical protein
MNKFNNCQSSHRKVCSITRPLTGKIKSIGLDSTLAFKINSLEDRFLKINTKPKISI